MIEYLRDQLADATGWTAEQASLALAAAVAVLAVILLLWLRSLWSRRLYYKGLAKGYRKASDSAHGPSGRRLIR